MTRSELVLQCPCSEQGQHLRAKKPSGKARGGGKGGGGCNVLKRFRVKGCMTEMTKAHVLLFVEHCESSTCTLSIQMW